MRFASQWLLASRRRCVLLALCQLILLFADDACVAAEPSAEGVSSREAKADAIRSVPFQRLSKNASKKIRSVVERPSFFRRMPSQQIDCDAQMFTFLVRRPEVMVNIWEIMGITNVSTRRVSPYSFFANDGVGTTCKCDLIYGDKNLHIYYGRGDYDGSMAPRKVAGRCVCIVRSQITQDANGDSTVQGTMDVFLKLDNFGADILTRTLGSFVGKTADQNFVETAKFISQISQICERSPVAAQKLAVNLENIDSTVQREFATIAARISGAAVSKEMPHTARRDYLDSSQLRYNAQSNQPQVDSSSRNTVQEFSLSDNTPVATGATSVRRSSPSQRPSAIAPHKPNVYMRR